MAAYREERAPLPVDGRTVVVVDDGVATGSTAVAAAHALRRRGAARVVLAVPVGPPGVAERLAATSTRSSARAGPRASSPSAPTTSTSTRRATTRSGRCSGRPVTAGPPPTRRAARRGATEGSTPRGCASGSSRSRQPERCSRRPRGSRPTPRGLVVFAHGSGSSRLSPAQRPGGGGARRRGPGDAALRSARRARVARPRQRLRHPAARRPPGCGRPRRSEDAELARAAGGALRRLDGRRGGARGGRGAG